MDVKREEKEKKAWMEDLDGQKRRFEMELEFVQLLSNPAYLQHLAATRLLSNEAFISYLRYLQYWKRPEYARFIVYPYSLFFLDQLQSEAFRKKLLLDPEFCALMTQQMENHWKYYRVNRLKKEEKPN